MPTPQQIAAEFVDSLKKHGLYAELPAIVEVLQAEVFRTQTITVITAVPLEKPEQEELKKTLFKKWGEHVIQFHVDRALLSGMIATYQDTVIDTSGRRALATLKESLT